MRDFLNLKSFETLGGRKSYSLLGLDISAMTKIHTQTAHDRIKAIDDKITFSSEEKLAYTNLNSLISSWQDHISALRYSPFNMNNDAFSPREVVPLGLSAQDSLKYINIDVNNGARTEDISISISQVAKAQKWKSIIFSDTGIYDSVTEAAGGTSLGKFKAGTFQIEIKDNAWKTLNSYNKDTTIVGRNDIGLPKIKSGIFYIDSNPVELNNTDSLSTIVNKINSSSPNVEASLVEDPTDNTKSYLLIVSKNLGAENNYSISDPNNIFTGGVNNFFRKNENFADIELFEGDSLDQIQKKINNLSKKTKLSAEVLEIEPRKYSLVLKSDSTGKNNAFVIKDNSQTVDTTTGGFSVFGNVFQANTGYETIVQEADNAVVVINGISIESQINTITNFNAKFYLYSDTEPGKTLRFRVQHNLSNIIKKVDNFITSYNDVITFINKQQQRDNDGNYVESAKIRNNNNLEQIKNNLHEEVKNLISAGIGIHSVKKPLSKGEDNKKMDFQNLLELDPVIFAQSITKDLAKVQNTFNLSFSSDSCDISPLSNRQQRLESNIDIKSYSLDIDINRAVVKSTTSKAILTKIDSPIVKDYGDYQNGYFTAGEFYINDIPISLKPNYALSDVIAQINLRSEETRVKAEVVTGSKEGELFLKLNPYKDNDKPTKQEIDNFKKVQLNDYNKILNNLFSVDPDIQQTIELDSSIIDTSSSIATNPDGDYTNKKLLTPGKFFINNIGITITSGSTLDGIMTAINNAKNDTGVEVKANKGSSGTYNLVFTATKSTIKENDFIIEDLNNVFNGLLKPIQHADNAISGVKIYDTSDVVRATVNTHSNAKFIKKASFNLVSSDNLKDGGVVKIINLSNESDSLVKGFGVFYNGKGHDKATIQMQEGIAENLHYISQNLRSLIKRELKSVDEKKSNLTKNKLSQEDKVKSLEKKAVKNFAKIQSASMMAENLLGFIEQLNNMNAKSK